MRAIAHPIPSILKYNWALQFLSLPIAISFAVENVWITALMISLKTPDIIDAFIWIIPNIISILIRPYLITIVHSANSPRRAEATLVSTFLLLAAFGCGIISAASVLHFKFVWRIVLCTIGWTLMDVCFEMVEFFGNKNREKLKKLGYPEFKQSSEWLNSLGYATGYLVSFGICLFDPGRNLKKFQYHCGCIYGLCAFTVLAYWIMIHINRENVFSSFHSMRTPINISHEIAFYLPGYFQAKSCSASDRWYLFLHFAYHFLLDTLFIYGSMWMVNLFELQGYKEGISFNSGMMYGSLLLLLELIIARLNFHKYLYSIFPEFSKSTAKVIRIFEILLAFACIVAALAFYNLSHLSYFVALAVLIGIVQSFYEETVYPALIQQIIVMESTVELVERMEKIFILCSMPFITMILMHRNDITDSLLWSAGVVGIGVVIFGIPQVLAKSKEKSKVSKIQ